MRLVCSIVAHVLNCEILCRQVSLNIVAHVSVLWGELDLECASKL